MFWEFLATVFAGLGMAGIALLARAVSRKRLPRWLIPIAAGVGMMTFQIYSEYTWFEHQATRLPAGVIVAKPLAQTTVWRPWSYFSPQVLRFIAADVANATRNQKNSDILRIDLYFFERHNPARRISQVFYCAKQARADFNPDMLVPQPDDILSPDWHILAPDDALLNAVCRYKAEKQPS